ncbi:MAG TPA: hypothetical protein VNI52_03725 [Sphingobacteriaceae bacterium]|nr:hypothetical protein [Sphingobacteriaceae bacterium]
MKNSTLEITDQDYLIKLPKDEFDLKFISSLLKRIQSEQLFFSRPVEADDIISRNLEYNYSARFDHLSDK